MYNVPVSNLHFSLAEFLYRVSLYSKEGVLFLSKTNMEIGDVLCGNMHKYVVN